MPLFVVLSSFKYVLFFGLESPNGLMEWIFIIKFILMFTDGDFSSTPSPGESLKHHAPCSCEDNRLHKLRIQGDRKETLESIWKRATELCQSNSLKNFLRKQGKLSSLCVNPGTRIWYF